MRVRKTHNLEMLATVANALKNLKEKVVFVGGATIDLYLFDPNVPDARPTDDVDCVVNLARRTEYHKLEEELRALHFQHPIGEKAPMCRWHFHGIKVDVMPTEGKILGFSNRWYADGVAKAETVQLPDGQSIFVFPVPYILASKMEAFLDRGKKDFQASPDLEDVLAIIDGYPQAKEKVLSGLSDVKAYLAEKFRQLLGDPAFVDAVPGHVVSGTDGIDRAERALSILKEMAEFSV